MIMMITFAAESFYKNIQYDAAEKQYSVSGPWKEYPSNLKMNSLWSRSWSFINAKEDLDKDKSLLQQYDQVTKSQEEKGIIEKIDENDSKNDLVHYFFITLLLLQVKVHTYCSSSSIMMILLKFQKALKVHTIICTYLCIAEKFY